MKNWYKSGPCKCALVVLEMLLTVVTVVSAVWVLSFPTSNLETLLKSDVSEAYEDTENFDESLYSAAASIIPSEHWGAALHLEKKDTLVDVKAFFEGNEITGKNGSGFAYRLDDLIAWWEHGYDYNYSGIMEGNESSEISARTRQSVVVCRAEDGAYAYYYNDDFYGRLLSGEFQPQLKQEMEERGADTIEELVDSYAEFDEFPAGKILDKEGNTLYEEVWRYDGLLIDERYKPEGAESILDIANRVPEWNGKLNEAEEELLSVLQSIGEAQSQIAQRQQLWSEGNTNVSYMLVEKDEKRVYSNREEFKDFAKWEDHVKQLKEAGRYVLITPKLADFDSNYETSAVLWRDLVNESRADGGDYVYLFAVDTSYPVQDTFYAVSKSFETYGGSVRAAFGIGVTGLALMIVVLVWLTIIAGRRGDNTEEVCLNSLDKVRTEIFLGIAGVLFVVPSMVFVRSMTYVGGSYDYRDELQTVSMPDVTEMVLIGGIAAVCCAAGLLLWLGIVRRFKAKTLWKNSFLYWIGGKAVRAGRRMWENIVGLTSQIGLIWKTALIVAAYILFQMLVVYQVSYRFSGDFWAFLLVVLDVAVFLFVMWDVIGRHRIQEGVKAIAEGQVDYQIQTDHMRAEQKKLAEGIHSIGDGLEHAVQESLKNERMKTDLITNVSHDIKTPLTSIINYVELLKRENFEDPKIQSYLKVLEEKSQRLKTLTKDVVEASKVSSGNINLEKMNLNLVELINQTSAEFEEKFAAKELDLRLTMPEEPMIVYADGRRMWRVLSNIFNNTAKYAMTHSRVYADLKDCGNTVQFQLKNISEQPLNIQADELTERFVRGDVSRNTEGSGLGLSIAKSLTEIQGGSFEIFVDGDLFKVVITFPKVKTDS